MMRASQLIDDAMPQEAMVQPALLVGRLLVCVSRLPPALDLPGVIRPAPTPIPPISITGEMLELTDGISLPIRAGGDQGAGIAFLTKADTSVAVHSRWVPVRLMSNNEINVSVV